ncbi:proline iminopeptidase-family hydrolase [Ktedonobacter robiniae]|uniref:Proline iminopeptidase n=1 Tax=Ktedonobacter robiniae TaxID=2778365 RepID=A0ABQ3UJQ3_9CHLR|nr:proline iminopeptidase-family hydrolase [Ktedonobacter robiniae]GHO52865.1 proline iminopeptidase [Ktedonobacter robiniae]
MDMIDQLIHEGYAPCHEYRTWYRIFGDPAAKPPLLAIHGGPGITSESLCPLEQLSQDGRAVIVYDQLGAGYSGIPATESTSLALFLEQLRQLIVHLRESIGLTRFHLFGHSWGGVLAMEYALAQPAELLGLILASTPASAPLMWSERQRLYEEQAPDIKQKLYDPEHGYQYFRSRFVCRLDPLPESYVRATQQTNTELNAHIWQQLAEWDICDRLAQITAHTLITAGCHDGMTNQQYTILQQGIPDSQLKLFSASAHYAHLEEPEAYRATLSAFLERIEHEQHEQSRGIIQVKLV